MVSTEQDESDNAPWRYDPAKDLDKSFAERLRQFPREPDLTVYVARSLSAIGIRLYLKWVHRLKIVGKENLPASGSFILVSNHSSHLDALCLASMIPLKSLHRVFPAAAEDYFFTTLPRTLFSAVFMNALPFGRYSHTRESLKVCQTLLSNPGNMLILFPEGTRTATGEIGGFKPGVGFLVAGTAIPVIPCRIRGSYAAWPKGRLLPTWKPVSITLGKPRAYAQHAVTKEAALRIADELRQEVMGMEGLC